jgi:2-iminoacetate synthase ThiH
MTVVDRTSSEFKSFLDLYERVPLLELGQLADAERWRHHPENVVTYIIDRNINYTNVCVADCKFCAFYLVLMGRYSSYKRRETIDPHGWALARKIEPIVT